MKLLAIPNDSTSAYFRNYEEDFLSEFNPRKYSGERIFDEVKFLNWKDDRPEVYYGISSIPFLQYKDSAKKLMGELSRGERAFTSPLFSEIFEKELPNLDRKILEYNPDGIRAFNTHFAAELGRMVSSRYSLPLIISAHDPSRLTPAITGGDSLVCISEDLKNLALNYGVENSKISIIPDGIDMDYFYPRVEDKVGVDAKYKILSVGRIVPSKNIETLLESLSILKGEFKGIKHLHLGNGTPEAIKNINKMKEGLGLNEISSFLGGVQKEMLPFYYSWADLYALPTLWEGLGRAQIESLACGTPVITSNLPPMNEVVIDGHNGFVADPENPEDFAEKIKKYFNSQSLRNNMEENSRKSVIDRYGMKQVMALHAENYEKFLK